MSKTATAPKPDALPQVAPASKRLVIVTGDKGGVGKSCFARLLLDTYRHKSIICRALDSDKSNPDLWRFYHKVGKGVELIDFTIRGEADHVIDKLGKEEGLVLVDLPARTKGTLERFIAETAMFERAQETGFRVTFCSVISKSMNSLKVLKDLLDTTGDQADHIVIRNLTFSEGEPEKFIRYNSSKVRERVLELKGVEVDLQEMFYTSWDPIEEHNIPFRFAASRLQEIPEMFQGYSLPKDVELYPTQRSRVNVWLHDMEKALEAAHTYLGLA